MELLPADWQERADSCHPSTVKRGPKGTQSDHQVTEFMTNTKPLANTKSKKHIQEIKQLSVYALDSVMSSMNGLEVAEVYLIGANALFVYIMFV
ncbi:hypothetical protein TNCV_1445311 [Trichonephila clavipes]|nr:hypothetical protein TNCV_1445311 [Trichonephila clavipes]